MSEKKEDPKPTSAAEKPKAMPSDKSTAEALSKEGIKEEPKKDPKEDPKKDAKAEPPKTEAKKEPKEEKKADELEELLRRESGLKPQTLEDNVASAAVQKKQEEDFHNIYRQENNKDATYSLNGQGKQQDLDKFYEEATGRVKEATSVKYESSVRTTTQWAEEEASLGTKMLGYSRR